jgi:hypothetical protein
MSPLQPLMLLNSKFITEQSTYFAERVKQEAGDDQTAQVRKAYELALCRAPRPEEVSAALEFLKAPPATDNVKGASQPPSSLAALCLVLLNTSEFAYAH